MSDKSLIAQKVRERRKVLHLRQGELAELAGVSARFVFAVEAGKASVQLDKLQHVLNVLGVDLVPVVRT